MDIFLAAFLILVITALCNYARNIISKRKQHVFIYCPRCGDEMIKNGTILELGRDIVKYKCSKCGNISFWDIAHYPVPVIRTCANCIHMELNNCGEATCEENCSPDTQICFNIKSVMRKEKKS